MRDSRKPNRRVHPAGALALLLGAFSALAALAQSPTLPLRLDTWERVDWKQADARDLEALTGRQAALLREYGSGRAEQATYRRGPAEWQVTLQEMQDRSGAYGAFTLLGGGGQPVPLGESGVRRRSGFLFYQGNHLVNVEGEVGLPDLQSLAAHLQTRAGPPTSLPTLPLYLPKQGLLAGSSRYVLGPLGLAEVAPLAAGDWVGFAYGAEVQAARYRVEGAEGSLLLISYPTPQIAVTRLRDFERLFNLNRAGNPLRPPLYARRIGTLVVLVTGLDSAEAAAALLERVRYELKVSWSDPADPRKGQSWAKTLVNLFIGTGLFLLFALLSGIAYGLLRFLIRRLAPGRVFDRPGRSEDVIMLDLHEKRR